jgi:hypothetical protein
LALGEAADWNVQTQPRTNLDQNMQTILEPLKQKAISTSYIAELEWLVL